MLNIQSAGEVSHTFALENNGAEYLLQSNIDQSEYILFCHGGLMLVVLKKQIYRGDFFIRRIYVLLNFLMQIVIFFLEKEDVFKSVFILMLMQVKALDIRPFIVYVIVWRNSYI